MANKDNARDFSVQLAAFGKQVPELARSVVRKYALDGLSGVVRKSPVDTGRFRGNWQISTSDEVAPTDRIDAGPRGSDPAALGQELAKLASVPAYGLVHIINGLPYAQRLEDGYSKQAPGGMVALTAAELSADIARGAAP